MSKFCMILAANQMELIQNSQLSIISEQSVRRQHSTSAGKHSQLNCAGFEITFSVFFSQAGSSTTVVIIPCSSAKMSDLA